MTHKSSEKELQNAQANTSYSNLVMQNFMAPKNCGVLKNPSGVGQVGNPQCGDIMKVEIEVKKDKKTGKEIIKNIKFQTFGCAAAIATSSMVTQLAKGKTLEEAKLITNKDVADKLEGLPPIKMHCSNLADRALKKAIEDYEAQRSREEKK